MPSTNQWTAFVALTCRDPFRLSVPQRRVRLNTAQSGPLPLLAVETRPVPHLCRLNRPAPCGFPPCGNAPLYVYVTMTPWETLELLKFVCLRRHRGPISMSSYSNTISTRWHCEASHSRVSFWRQSGSFLILLYHLREAMAPMITQGKDEDDTIWQDAHAMGKMDTRKWTFSRSFCNSLAYDGLRCPHEWPDVSMIRAEF